MRLSAGRHCTVTASPHNAPPAPRRTAGTTETEPAHRVGDTRTGEAAIAGEQIGAESGRGGEDPETGTAGEGHMGPSPERRTCSAQGKLGTEGDGRRGEAPPLVALSPVAFDEVPARGVPYITQPVMPPASRTSSNSERTLRLIDMATSSCSLRYPRAYRLGEREAAHPMRPVRRFQ